MAVTVTWAMTARTVETLPTNTGSASDANRRVTHDQYDEGGTLDSGTTPQASLISAFLLTLTGGVATIDLTALTGTNGAVVNGNGLKVQLLRIKNLGANNMTFTEGAANGYAIFGTGNSVTVFPGGVEHRFTNGNAPVIAGADKTIDVSGTGSQTAEVTIILG